MHALFRGLPSVIYLINKRYYFCVFKLANNNIWKKVSNLQAVSSLNPLSSQLNTACGLGIKLFTRSICLSFSNQPQRTSSVKSFRRLVSIFSSSITFNLLFHRSQAFCNHFQPSSTALPSKNICFINQNSLQKKKRI